MEEKSLITTPDADSPSDLLSAAQRGDKEAFYQLVKGCERTLYRVSYTVLQDDRDCADAVQEAISTAWLQLETLREPGHFRTWLIRILLDECCRQAKHGRRAAGKTEPTLYDNRVRDEITDLEDSLAGLPVRHRLALVLFHVEGMTVEEIARVQNVAESAVKNSRAGAREALAALQPTKDAIENLFGRLKETYKPTPMDFPAIIRETANALPERAKRRSRPTPAVVAFAVAACAVFALLLSGVLLSPGITGKMALPSAQPSPSPSQPISSQAQQSSPLPTANTTSAPSLDENNGIPALPPASPLPALAISDMSHAPDAEAGWQAAAFSGGVTWYFNPSKSELARAEGGNTVSFTLSLAEGQQINAYTFQPSKDGRWLAFTVHTATGDTVWLVTSDGRKMVIPDDTRLTDGYGQTIQADFSGCAMTPVDSSYYGDDYIMIMIGYPDNSVYELQVQLNDDNNAQTVDFNVRRGWMRIYPLPLASGDRMVAYDTFLYKIGREKDGGAYTIDLYGNSVRTDLKSNRFSLFKAIGGSYILFHPIRALLIYEGDPTRTLWELNLLTGKSKSLASDCFAAGWLNGTTYWYASGVQPAKIQTHVQIDLKTVLQQAEMSIYINSENGSDSSVSLHPSVLIQNNTDKDLTVPTSVPCSLALTKDGRKIWGMTGGFSLENAKNMHIIGRDAAMPTGAKPIAVHSGEMLEMELAEIPYQGPGSYRLRGTFFQDRKIDYSFVEDSAPGYHYGVDITGNLTPDHWLNVSLTNKSHVTFTFPQPFGAYQPPTLCYRLFSGGKMLETGSLKLASKPLSDAKGRVEMGNACTLLEQGDTPRFASLPEGEYRLECLMNCNTDDAGIPWEFRDGIPFDVTFTILKQ